MKQIFLNRPGQLALVAAILAIGLYWRMIAVTLPRIEAISGLIPFDMRPTGYTPAQAAHLLEALGPQGRTYYLASQIPLDMLYPGLLALTLTAMIFWLGTPVSKLGRIGIALAVAAGLADYAENLAIVLMIRSWPDLPDALVRASSFLSVLKAVSTTAAVLVVLALCLARARHSLLSRLGRG